MKILSIDQSKKQIKAGELKDFQTGKLIIIPEWPQYIGQIVVKRYNNLFLPFIPCFFPTGWEEFVVELIPIGTKITIETEA